MKRLVPVWIHTCCLRVHICFLYVPYPGVSVCARALVVCTKYVYVRTCVCIVCPRARARESVWVCGCVCTYVYVYGWMDGCKCGLRVCCEDDRARIASRNRYRPVECLGEDWTRNRHTVAAGPWEREGVSPSFIPCLCPSLPASMFLRPPCALAASSLRYWCASSLSLPPSAFLPFSLSPFLPRSLRETSEHRRVDSLHRPTINTPAGPYFRPRNRNFHSSLSSSCSFHFPRRCPRRGSTFLRSSIPPFFSPMFTNIVRQIDGPDPNVRFNVQRWPPRYVRSVLHWIFPSPLFCFSTFSSAPF